VKTNLRSKVSLVVRSLLLFACLPSISPAQTQPPIYPLTQLLYPSGPIDALVTGDFNNDGQPDIAYISPPPAGSAGVGQFIQIVVLLNQGANSAPLPVVTTSVTCAEAYSLVAADLNNDRQLGLVLACPTTGYVVVLLGNGDGTFQKPAYYAVSGAQSLATPVDLNGDGFLDVAVTASQSCTSATVNVLLNQGSASPGTLLNPKSYAISPAVCIGAIGTGDFNGDGKQDFIVQNTASQLEVFFGNGDGTLQPPQTTATGGIFATGDFNNDGLTDVACVIVDPQNVQPPSLRVFLGSTGGTLTTGVNLTLQPQSNYSALIPTGSGNGGNNANLALVGDNTSILVGDGKGGFTLGPAYAVTAHFVQETDSSVTPSLVYATESGIVTLAVNGTFIAPPAYFVGSTGFTPADVNGDGLTDILSIDNNGILRTALSRGDGTFSLASEVPAIVGELLTPGDFNGDGKVDVAAIIDGDLIDQGLVTQDSELFFYKGNGDGTFQNATAPVSLQISGAAQAVTGDFNGDGQLDLVVSYSNTDPDELTGSGLVLLPGNGDGSFGAPVIFSQSPNPQLFAADLNNDGMLDLISNTAVYLGHGDGTFKQLPLGLTGTLLAVGDLNGDGIPDVVIGASVHAGNGDGTFQTSPFYTAPAPQNFPVAATIGDVNADGHPDLLLQYSSPLDGLYYLSVSYGDGKGNFVLDGNAYPLGNPSINGLGSFGSLARLNDHAPLPPNDNAPDFLAFTNASAAVLLNRLNPTPTTLPAPAAPTPPSALLSFTALFSSAIRAFDNQQLTFNAGVSGANNPTGTISFVSGNTILGTATIANGGATLPFSFSAPGVYSVTANYSGDAHNLPSTSNSISVTIMSAQTTLTVSSASADENQQVTFTATVTVSGVTNPTGTVTFTAGNTLLGTATLANGTATLPVSFTAPGVIAVTAQYAFATNIPVDTSNTVSVTIAAPDFALSASPTSATIQAGQSATFAITVTPSGGYSGTVNLSCGALPSEVTCTFSSTSLAPVSGMPSTSTLTLATKPPANAAVRPGGAYLSLLVWGGLLCFACSTRRIHRKLTRAGLLLVFLAAALIAPSGCSSSSQPQGPEDLGTPIGTQSVSIVAADSTGAASHSLMVQLTVQ
jgi:Bacterial Ig-like domain (group 3)/FG-GAP-like repeat